MPRGKRLTPDQRLAIERSTASAEEIAAEHGVSPATVYRIKREARRPSKAAAGRSWKYSEEDKERALTMLVVCGGNATDACRKLRKMGAVTDLSPSTLLGWADEQPQRVELIRQNVVSKLHERIAADAEDLALEAARLEREALEKLKTDLQDIPARDMPAAVRSITTIKAINADKAALFRGKPTVIQERRDIGETIAALQRLGVKLPEQLADPGSADREDPRQIGPADSGGLAHDEGSAPSLAVEDAEVVPEEAVDLPDALD